MGAVLAAKGVGGADAGEGCEPSIDDGDGVDPSLQLQSIAARGRRRPTPPAPPARGRGFILTRRCSLSLRHAGGTLLDAARFIVVRVSV